MYYILISYDRMVLDFCDYASIDYFAHDIRGILGHFASNLAILQCQSHHGPSLVQLLQHLLYHHQPAHLPHLQQTILLVCYGLNLYDWPSFDRTILCC